MRQIINEINQYKKNHKKKEITFKNNKLITQVNCYYEFYSKKLIDFSNAFNNLFKGQNSNNTLITYIVEDENIFNRINNYIKSNDLIETNAIKDFNKATLTTSLAKCSKDKKYYIIKCYAYFIYIFNKNKQECFMIVKKNKKAITMINILLLTPYLMYGELYGIHGGLVNKDNQNILINNSSLGGKTTFALLFALNNWDIITEETTYITKQGAILPYNIRNYFNIRVGTYLAFEDYFLEKGIINETFLSMKNKNRNELFKYGKKNQFSINFDIIGKNVEFSDMRITHSLKVSITEKENIEISKCSSTEIVKSFLELSLAPTVLLFQELLNYNNIDIEKRTIELNDIFKNIESFILKSGFNYREKFNYIIKTIHVKQK